MFASRASKAPPKTGVGTAAQQDLRRATFSSQRCGESGAAKTLPPSIFYDFSNVPVFARDRLNEPQARSALSAPPLLGQIQAKLIVGDVDDPLERQADRLADDVMRTPSPRIAGSFEAIRHDDVQRASANVANETAALAIVRDVLRQAGEPLDPRVRAFAEPRFGRDFSGVRTHTGAQAAASARALGASAFTVGSHVVFGEGRYAPGSTDGQRLLAHELTHTIQQRAVPEANCAFAGALVQRQTKGGPAAAQAQASTAPPWTSAEIKAIQKQLARLGLYSLAIDGKLGEGSKSGLVEAFGGDEWQTLDAATTLSRLAAAKPTAIGKKGEHSFRWGEMFKDGVLDMALGVGFDEDGVVNASAHAEFVDALAKRKFVKNSAAAAELYKKAGRKLGPSAFGDFYVRTEPLTYTPPAGPTRKVDAVVRLVTSIDGSKGAQAADAFKEGMVSSDISFYSGHARYGSGPDFDRNFSVDLLDARGAVEQTFNDYKLLEKALEQEGAKAKRDAWGQFQWRVKNKRIDVRGSNAGNVVLNTTNTHPGEFGGKLMYWNLNRAKGGAAAVTGATGSLATAAAAAPERKYRVIVFDACTTQDYVKSIRATPGFNSKQADVVGSSRPLYWRDYGNTLAQFLDDVVKMQSAEQTITNMDKLQSAGSNSIHGSGIADNPVIK